MGIMQLLTAWNSTVHQGWKPCVDQSISKTGLSFLYRVLLNMATIYFNGLLTIVYNCFFSW